MTGIAKKSLPAALEEARRRFEGWRKTRAKLGPIPGELWQVAIEAAREHGVNLVSGVLHLEYDRLRHRLSVSSQPARPSASAATFLEVSVPPPTVVAECVVEMERPDGSRMRIRLTGQDHLVALSETFWRCRA